MSAFFYQLVTDAVNHNDTDLLEELYSLELSDIKNWCKCQLNERISHPFLIDSIINDLDTEFDFEFWRYIQTHKD